MHERSRGLLLSVLALSFVMLLVVPAAASAQSEASASLSMDPATAAPGATVEVVGLGFPRNMTAVIELVSAEGVVTLATVATAGDGAFRHALTLPAGVPAGTWTLSARSADGTATGEYTFGAGDPNSRGARNSTSDNLVLVLMGVLLGAVATGGLFAWRMVQDLDAQPGMGSGDDLIWSGSPDEAEPELTSTDEPFWKSASAEADDGASAAHEAPTSA